MIDWLDLSLNPPFLFLFLFKKKTFQGNDQSPHIYIMIKHDNMHNKLIAAKTYKHFSFSFFFFLCFGFLMLTCASPVLTSQYTWNQLEKLTSTFTRAHSKQASFSQKSPLEYCSKPNLKYIRERLICIKNHLTWEY